MTSIVASQRAEEFVLAALLREPKAIEEIVGSMLEPCHFWYAPYRIIYEAIVERHFADEAVDALLIGEQTSKKLAALWKIDEREAIDKVLALRGMALEGAASATDHAGLVKKHADYRSLMDLSQRIARAVEEESDDPEVLASAVSADAMRIATDRLLRHETRTYGELGKRFVTRMQEVMAMRLAGVEVGATYGIRAIDDFTNGHQPGELLILGGPPGAGKSALGWTMARNFARGQMKHPEDRRVGAMILSLEMGEDQSTARMAQTVGRIEGEKLRKGTLTRDELRAVAGAWAAERDLPLYANHAGKLRMAQLRAIVTESMRRGWNCGVVIIDHFKMLVPDEKGLIGNDVDDAIVIGLKDLAKDLDIAVTCLAHTVKTVNTADKRPRMEDLRGSGMISAFADFVGLLHRPFDHATPKQREQGQVGEQDAELIWIKSRQAGKGTGEFFMDLSTMNVSG